MSKKSGTRFTYKLQQKKLKGVAQCGLKTFFLSVLNGPDLYRFSGIVSGPDLYVYNHARHGRLISKDAPSVKAFVWFLEHVQNSNIIHKDLEFWHEGKCGKCGRPLTVPSSIAKGIGPSCAAFAEAKLAA